MEKVFFAADELTGLIWSCALMRPSKSMMDMEVKNLKKKFKDKKFAAGCSREIISQGAVFLLFNNDKKAGLSCQEAIHQLVKVRLALQIFQWSG